ncbi:organic cation transporter protein-like [Lingula anatina]|uniref:Organic cation transporter protein-like n=1 Tax=Lingula anatina TaxID=7574 RepID=A0A1S3H3R3_LINAN|nr:organic cation transporter protein-like [Lingula anatina]|eukprot:XP_013380106.1 organic cation transporter protein-like [Lingula anatina]
MEKLEKKKPSTARSDVTAEKQTQLDDIFEQMGDFGRFQLRVLPLFCLCSTLASLQYMSVPFMGYTPEHRLGRRTALGCALLFLSASGLASTFSPNVVTAILFKFLIGASSSGAYTTSFSFGMEVVGPKKRMFAGIIMHFFFAAGSCGTSGIAYALRHWRYLQAAITAPALLLAVYTWTVPESIRWLLSRGRKEDAKQVAKRVARQNGRHIKSYDIFDNLKVDAVPQKSNGILKELWKTPRLVFHTVLLSLIWGLVEATWFGISLNSGNIEGSIFVNYFLRELQGQNMFSSKSTLPLIIFGVISVSGGLASILLPESANKPLPQTIAEVRNAYTSLPAKIALAVIGVREPDSPPPN